MSYKLNQKCVDEVGHNFVVVGGFEDRADHLNKKDYFRLYLQGSDNLRYRYPMQDWTHFTIEMSSGIISPLGEHGAYTQVYVVEDEYTSRRAAKHAMHQEDNFSFPNICRELFAQC